MRSHIPAGLWLAAWAACGALHGQANNAGQNESTERTAEVWVVADPRGDIDLTVVTSNLSGVRLDRMRRIALPCDWRVSQSQDQLLEGTCRRYLASDGGLAHGRLALAPLVRALRQGGAQSVHLELNDFGRPVLEGPVGWAVQSTDTQTPFGALKSNAYRFVSHADGEVPEAFEIRIGRVWSPSHVALPFAITLLVPLMIALLLRRRTVGPVVNGVNAAWLHWMLIGVWVYWDSAVAATDVAAVAARLQVDSMFVTLLIGSAVFTLPPLFSAASCAGVLAWPGAGGGGRSAWRSLVGGSVAREAVTLVPFGILAVALGMFEQDWKTSLAGWPLAYLSYRALHWRVTWRYLGTVEELTTGDLYEGAVAAAKRAGVRLNAVYLASSRAAQRATAFVSDGRSLTLTQGLVESFTRRELDALVARESRTLRLGYVSTRAIVYWTYVLLVAPIAGQLAGGGHLTQLVLRLPIVVVAYIFCCMRLSAYRERRGDLRTVEQTGDAEGLAAALARFEKLARGPVVWGGIQESVLSHLAVQARILALAKRFGIGGKRAMELMDRPDALSEDPPPDTLHYALPPEDNEFHDLCGPADKAEYATWARWVGYLPLSAVTVAALEMLARVAQRPSAGWWIGLGLVLPLTGWGYLWMQDRLEGALMARLRRKMERQRPELAGGIFAGILPGECAGPDRFTLHDVGMVLLSPGYFDYYGGHLRFTVSSDQVKNISVWKGPPAWIRSYGVRLECDAGSFIVLRPERRASIEEALGLERGLERWRRTEAVERAGIRDAFPCSGNEWWKFRSNYASGLRTIPATVLRAVSLCLSLVILEPFELLVAAPAAILLPFVAAGAYVFAVCPRFIRWKPAIAIAGETMGRDEATGVSAGRGAD